MLLNATYQLRWPGAPLKPSLSGTTDFAWNYLAQPALATDVNPCGIAIANITDTFSPSASFTAANLGLTFTGSLEDDYSINLTVAGLSCRSFVDGLAGEKLYNSILAFTGNGSITPAQIKDTFMVTDAFYASSFVAEFKSNGNATAKADFTKAGATISGSGSITWQDDYTATITGPPTVPFAVRGRRVNSDYQGEPW